jgi:AcrR family transcriptional regulator
MSADARREQILAAAIDHFGRRGYHAASTEAIAADCGISQPYLFRLFPTKRELFLACVDAVHERVADAFRTAAEGVPQPERLGPMGHAYVELLEDRSTLRMTMQAYAASADPDIQAHVRARYRQLVHDIAAISEASDEEVWVFTAHGMLLNVIAALDLASVAGEDEWAAKWAQPKLLMGLDQDEEC